MNRTMGRLAKLAAALALVATTSVASAQPIIIGCTATTDCASAAVAVDEGIFARNGLEAQLLLIGLNSTIPAGLLSDSIQIGGPTPSVFLQAVDGGLDLVAISGASSTAASTADTAAVVARSGVTIASPADFSGKKIGVPGIGAFLQVLFTQYLIENDVDPGSVDLVEVTFPTMNDVLASGAVDAVVTAEPVLSRIVKAGTGSVVANFLEDLPERRPQILYAATREWADANPEALSAFRKSIEEASAIVNENVELARASVSKFTSIPLDVLSNMKLSVSDPKLDPEQLEWWTGVMNGQDMLQTEIDAGSLIQP